MKNAICITSLSIILVSLLIYKLDTAERKVKNGAYTLTCEMQDGRRVIAPELITDFIEDTWIFTNGSAKNCTITKVIKK